MIIKFEPAPEYVNIVTDTGIQSVKCFGKTDLFGFTFYVTANPTYEKKGAYNMTEATTGLRCNSGETKQVFPTPRRAYLDCLGHIEIQDGRNNHAKLKLAIARWR